MSGTASPSTLALAALATERQRQAADPAASAWVAANAGTGKTKVLTDRVLNLLLAGTAPHRILCLTFTKAAAAEMANRLAAKLAGWAVMPDAELAADLGKLDGRTPEAATLDRARRLFARVLDVPGGMKIETIHAFCQALLRRFPLEAGVGPNFAVLDPRDEAELLLDARERVLLKARAGSDERLAEALAVVTASVHETRFDALVGALTDARGRLGRLFEHHGGLDGAILAVHQRLGVPPGSAPQALIAAACTDAAFARHGIAALAQAMGSLGGKTDRDAADAIARFLALAEAERPAAWDDYQSAFLTQKGEPRSLSKYPSKAVKEARPDLLPVLEAEQTRLLILAEQVKAAAIGRDTAALLTLAEALLGAYAAAKSRRGQLDFDDLIQGARRLLARSSAAAWVLFKLDGGLDHLLIDEAQDTGPDQWDVVTALAAEFFAGEGVEHPTARTLFVVGDRKQSIYSFQGADPDRFESMRAHYAQRIPQAGQSFHDVELAVSFRSTRAVLEAVDAVFRRPEAAAGVAPTLGNPALGNPALGSWVEHLPFRVGQGGMVEIWPPFPATVPDIPAAWRPPVERVKAESAQTGLARLVARRIQAMVGGQEMLPSRGRPIRPGDILVLVRRRAGFVEDLVRALKGLGVPVAGVDRMVLTDQLAVMDLLALAKALLLPEDDLTLATVLKGPLFAFTEDDLFTVAHGRKDGERLWHRLYALAEHAGPFQEAHRALDALRARADFLPPHELFAEVLSGPLDGRRRLLARLGPEAADPLDEFIALTLAFDRAHPPSLQAFVHWVEAGAQDIKRDLEKGAEDGPGAVRVMTVHGSKGLQAPVVFLPDTRQTPRLQDPILWQDGEPGLPAWVPAEARREAWTRDLHAAAKAAQEEEYRRLLYVALTRAEDRLYVCGWDGLKAAPAGNWYDLVRAGVAPLAAEVEDPFLAADGALPSAQVLRLTCPQTVTPEAGTATAAAPDGGPLPAWARDRSRPPSELSPPRPLAPSQPLLPDPPVRSPLDGAGASREQARFQRGRLIHRLLQSLPDLPPIRRAEAARAFLSRPVWALSDGEIAQYAAETLAVLEHPDFAPLFAPGSLAEVPLSGVVGGHVVSGQVDRLLVTDGAVWVVDFKTNRPPPHDPARVPEAYLFQMAAYRAVLERIYPNRPVRCLLLWTDGPSLMALPPTLLDAALERLLKESR